jgi:hypothetical protein
MPNVNVQTHAQRLAHLEAANAIRTAKAQDKRALKRGELRPEDIILNPPVHWQKAPLVELLVSLHYVNRRKAAYWCQDTGCRMDKRIGDLNPPERALLAIRVRRHTSVKELVA